MLRVWVVQSKWSRGTIELVEGYNRTGRGDGVTFHRIAKVSTGQGRRTEELTAKRRRLWLAKVGRKNWNLSDNARICSAHFVLGKTYKDWSGQSHCNAGKPPFDVTQGLHLRCTTKTILTGSQRGCMDTALE